MTRCAVILSLLALSGCDDPLKPVDRVEEPRVLAARVEVDGAPERQSPAPGETAHVRWLVAGPNGNPASGFGLFACSAPAQSRGPIVCSAPPFASAGAAPSSQPTFDFTVPPELDVKRAPHMAVLGALCAESSGSVENDEPSCDDGERMDVRLDFDLADGALVNLNPSFADTSLELDDTAWPTLAAPAAGCQGSGLPEISAADGARRLRVTLAESAREELPRANAADPPRETLTLSHFASSGDLSSAFSVLGSSDAYRPFELTWAPPAPGAEATLVRFWFVIRDGRGGSDFTERALCVLP